MTEQVDLLISNAVVVTVDNKNQVIRDGAVAVRDDRIVAVGPSASVKSVYTAGRTIDGTDKLVMPGLVDTYHHAGHGMIKGIYRPGLGWPASEIYFHGSTPDWWHAEGLLTAVERVKFGVTTGVTIMGATPARADDPVFAERNAAAVEAVGTRAFIAVGPPDPFIGHLRQPWSGTFYENGTAVERPFTYERTIDVSRDVIGRLNGMAGGRIQMMFAIPYLCGMNPEYMTGTHYYPYTTEEARLLRDKGLEARQIANEYGVRMHTHVARGSFEWAQDSFGEDALNEILGPDVLGAHANGLTERDIGIMEQTGCAAIAVPFGSWNTRIGTCPIVKLIQRNIPVAIATDGAAPFHISDLFIDLHRAMFLQWMENHDMSLLPAGKAVRLVTIEAAALLGMDHEIGSLEPGKKADMILLDLNQPHLVPFEDPANMIAFYVRGNDVDTVIVDGAILMEGCKVMTVDESDVLGYARDEIRQAFARIDISPYLDEPGEFWQGWRI